MLRASGSTRLRPQDPDSTLILTAVDNGKGVRRSGILNMLQIGHNTVGCALPPTVTAASVPPSSPPVPARIASSRRTSRRLTRHSLSQVEEQGVDSFHGDGFWRAQPHSFTFVPARTLPLRSTPPLHSSPVIFGAGGAIAQPRPPPPGHRRACVSKLFLDSYIHTRQGAELTVARVGKRLDDKLQPTTDAGRRTVRHGAIWDSTGRG